MEHNLTINKQTLKIIDKNGTIKHKLNNGTTVKRDDKSNTKWRYWTPGKDFRDL